MNNSERNISTYSHKFGKKSGRERKGVTGETNFDGTFQHRPALLMSAYNCWNSLAQWRQDIRRNEEFVYGDQHADKVYDWKSQSWKTERQLFVEQGLQPSQYNIIRNIIRTITGVWSSNKTMPSVIAQKDDNQKESEMLTATLHAFYRKAELSKLDYSQLNSLIIIGAAIVKPHYANRDNDSDVVNDYIDPYTFIVDNNMKDPRYKDCTLVGCFYDLSVDDISGMFNHGDRKRARQLRELYGDTSEERIYQSVETFTDKRIELNFFVPETQSQGLGRVIEIWRKESAECFWVHDMLHGTYLPDFESTESDLKALLAQRIAEQAAMGVSEEDMLLLEWTWGRDSYWKYYYLSPWGHVLDSGINPFWHDQAPIVFEFHDFFVGKIYPFVKDLIDVNKQINKLAAISELLSKYSAKSLMLLPTQSIATEQGYGIDYIERKMTDYDAVIPYDASVNGGLNKPEFINTIAQAFTPLNVVNMYLKLSEQTSGVYGALQGQQPTAGTPAQMYAQQSQNSASSLNGIFDAINSWRVRRDKMNVQLMQQFYTDKKYVYDKNEGMQLLYDPELVKNIDTDISVVENTDTPAYRLMINDILIQLKQFDPANTLDLRGLVEVGNFPFKDKLLDYLNKRDKEMQEMQAGQLPPGAATPMPQDLQQGLSQYQFNPELQQQYATKFQDAQQ